MRELPKIIVVVEGGMVQDVILPPELWGAVDVEIQDHDITDGEEEAEDA